jgi:aspartyl-tRNA(Asn)/glutamyl-tRNA(Gln) amidotransferase subunit B
MEDPAVDVAALAAKLGLLQVSDTAAIDAAIDAAIARNPKAVADFQAGKQNALGPVIGMILKAGKGLNPKLVQERIRAKLSS